MKLWKISLEDVLLAAEVKVQNYLLLEVVYHFFSRAVRIIDALGYRRMSCCKFIEYCYVLF